MKKAMNVTVCSKWKLKFFFFKKSQKSRKRKFASIKINIEIKTKNLTQLKVKKDLRGGGLVSIHQRLRGIRTKDWIIPSIF